MHDNLHEIITAACKHRGRGTDPDSIFRMVKGSTFRDTLSMINTIEALMRADEDENPENGHDPFGVNL